MFTEKVSVWGPGVERGVKPQQKTHFIIDSASAGAGQATASVKDDKGKDIPVTVTDQENGQFIVEYTPPAAGKYKVSANFGGKPVPGTPVDVNVTPVADVSKVKVDGLDPSECYCYNVIIFALIRMLYFY